MQRWHHLGLATCVVALSVGCAQPPYTATDARADLEAAGWSPEDAACVVRGLERYFREEFEQKADAEGIEQVSKRQVDNYIKNKLASTDTIPEDLDAETQHLVAECRNEA